MGRHNMSDIDYEKEPRVLELADLGDILADIVSRLERIEKLLRGTKPRAQIDEGYKSENTQKNQKGDTNGKA